MVRRLETVRRGRNRVVWTTIIAGLRTYGATMRKMILRIVGAVLGGLQVLLVMIFTNRGLEIEMPGNPNRSLLTCPAVRRLLQNRER